MRLQLQIADAGGHFTDVLHGLDDVLHSHIFILRKLSVKIFRSDADLVQHLAVASHILNQILDNNVLHSINTFKIE